MKISDVMNKAFVTDDNITGKEAAKIMSDKNVGSLIVMKNEKIVGLITEGDIMKNISRLGSRVSSIMSKNVITIEKNSSLDDAAELMSEKKIKRLPVLSKGELVGIVTATDILAHADSLNEEFLID